MLTLISICLKLDHIRCEMDSAPSSNQQSVVEYEIITGHREDTKLLYLLNEKQLYKKNSITKLGTHYLCIVNNCSARVYVKDGVCFKSIFSKSGHNHGLNDVFYKKLSALNDMKAKITVDKNTPLREIFNEVMSR